MNQNHLQKIFLEEAKENLETLKNGLNELNFTLQNKEISESIFRAFFALKGGSIILSFDSFYLEVCQLEKYFQLVYQNNMNDIDIQKKITDGMDTLENSFKKLNRT